MLTILTFLQFLNTIIAQINFGTISLKENKHGDLELDFNQAANLFGFGGDRDFGITLGEGVFKTKLNQGALIGGERVGLESGLDANEATGLNLGSSLNFGNDRNAASNPAGQFLSFVDRIGKFLTSFVSPKGTASQSSPKLVSEFAPVDSTSTILTPSSDDTVDNYYSDLLTDEKYPREETTNASDIVHVDLSQINSNQTDRPDN